MKYALLALVLNHPGQLDWEAYGMFTLAECVQLQTDLIGGKVRLPQGELVTHYCQQVNEAVPLPRVPR